jgi:O-antigen/teichoic acid export membrane protein
MNNSFLQRITLGTTSTLCASIVAQAGTLFINIALARMLGSETYGLFVIAQSTVNISVLLSTMAIGNFCSKYVAEYRSLRPDLAGEIVGLARIVSTGSSLLAAGILITFAAFLADVVLHRPALRTELTVGAAAVFCNTIAAFQVAVLAGLEAYRPILIAAGVGTVASVIFTISGAMYRGLFGAVVGLAIAAIIRILFNEAQMKRALADAHIAINCNNFRNHLRIVRSFLAPAALSGMVSLPSAWISNVFLINGGGGSKDVSLYAVANNIRALAMLVVNVLNSVTLSILNQARGGETQIYWSVYRRNVTLLVICGITTCLLLAAIGRQALRLFGSGYNTGYPLVMCLLLAVSLEAISIGLYQIVQAEGAMWGSLWRIVIPREIVFLLLAANLTKSYGAFGLAAATVGAQLMNVAMTLYLVKGVGKGVMRG